MGTSSESAAILHTASIPGRERSESICELVIFAEANPDKLLERMQNVLDGEDIRHVNGLKWISYHCQDDFNHAPTTQPYRAVIVAYGVLELKRQLTQIVKMVQENPYQAFAYPAAGLYYGFGSPNGKLAYLFPGQGAQYTRMGEELAEIYPKSKKVWDTLGSIPFNGKTINEVVFAPEPADQKEASAQADELACSDWSMPSINLMSESIRVLLETMSVKPDAVAAHSAGDAASYRAAGIISSEEMIHFARHRGVRASTCPVTSSGGILMVFSDPQKAHALLRKHDIKQVWIANYNTPFLIVLAGNSTHLKETKEIFAKESIKSKLIPISGAPHCPLALRASNLVAEYISNLSFGNANCDVYSYLFGKKMDNDPDLFRKVLAINCLKPVKFVDQINHMYEAGVRTFVEIGPSEGLTVFVEKILGEKSYQAISTNRRKGDANFHFLSAVAELIKLGWINNTNVLWNMYDKPLKPAFAVDTRRFEEQPDKTSDLFSKEMDRLKALDLQLSRINKIVNG